MKRLFSLVFLFLALFPANAFALTPVPEPTSMILIVAGLIGVLAAGRFLQK